MFTRTSKSTVWHSPQSQNAGRSIQVWKWNIQKALHQRNTNHKKKTQSVSRIRQVAFGRSGRLSRFVGDGRERPFKSSEFIPSTCFDAYRMARFVSYWAVPIPWTSPRTRWEPTYIKNKEKKWKTDKNKHLQLLVH